MAKQLYDYWFVQFDFPNEDGKPYKSSGGKMVWNDKLKREIPEGWEVLLVGDILDKVQNTPRLATSEYMTSGQYPIIDQTANIYHAGFTAREDAVSRQFPAVVFGDHSCAVKYVNFPFVRGADGTQIMLSKDDRISIEYLYFATKNIPLREGYARHYSILKESYIIAPTIYIAKLYQKLAVKQFELITSNRKEIIELSKQRDELLPLLMNGQVSVNYHLSTQSNARLKILVIIGRTNNYNYERGIYQRGSSSDGEASRLPPAGNFKRNNERGIERLRLGRDRHRFR